ncbi:hypothetical protein [Haloglycomyces albus]|uniref:hypothetical protein n=1 Tax=Haloglycomyces albus TaxID=526067 RepID=UPI00046D66FA|nr:hypothetical protein [Haloglycomyces albus]
MSAAFEIHRDEDDFPTDGPENNEDEAVEEVYEDEFPLEGGEAVEVGLPLESNEADAMEQRQEVPEDDDAADREA